MASVYTDTLARYTLDVSAIPARNSGREEYSISQLNPRKNPYTNQLKKQITINIDSSTIEYFKGQAREKGIPYQTLINLYLRDCVDHHRQLQLSWE